MAKFAGTALLALLVFTPLAGRTTQLNLSTSPLFLTVPVPSNIFFLHDDSGSMDWDLMTGEDDGVMTLTYGSNSTLYAYVIATDDNAYQDFRDTDSPNTYGRVLPSEEAVQATANMPSDYHGVWRGRYHGYNKMYYNPEVDYKPWSGVASNGVLLPDAKAPATEANYIAVTALRLNPYNSGSATLDITTAISWKAKRVPTTLGGTTDVTVSNYYIPRYYTWSDDGDGVVESTDTHAKVEIVSTTATYTRTSGNRIDCTDPLLCTYAEEIKNFANWFMYYRKRQKASKNAIGKVIAQAQYEARMGHATLNNNGGSSNVNKQIALMNVDAASGNKKALLDALYKVESSGGTPLRDKLDEAGRYFGCASGNIFGLSAGSSACPIATAASGGTCQQNFTVLMSDGYWNDNFTGLPGNDNTDADGNSPDAAGNTIYDGGAFADNYASTLADVAMHYYERDLATGLSNQVPVTAGVDNATHQHMVTYTVAFGVSGTLSAGPTSTTQSFAWPNPTAGDAQKIDDLRHAAYNGRGQFLGASNPDDLVTSLQNTIGSIGDRTGSSASVAVNSRSLSTTTRLYQARFTSGDWNGDLRALSLDAEGNVDTTVWSAKDQLKNQNWSTGRAILTRTDTAGIPFRWTTSGTNALTATQQSNLNQDPVTSNNDGQGQARLEYLRGNTAHEGTGNNYRSRTGGFKLGDIVNSSPIYVGAPVYLPDLEETAPHASFRSSYVSRSGMVYVGANDGMLHGFDADTGDEKIAYVPSAVFSSLNKLTNPNYTHRYYVDSSPTVGDGFGTFTNVSGTCATGCWRTVLVGGLAGGGKGVFALDITDPEGTLTSGLAFYEANAAKLVLWELPALGATDSDMGYVYGQPTIAKVKNGTNSFAYAAIFGNGYNSTNENAVLYIVNIVNGSVIRKINLNNYAGSTGNSNGLSAPAVVDVDGDFIADYVYVGDLRGNMWKIDLTSKTTGNWDSAFQASGKPAPLFAAKDASDVEQPITVRPEVSSHPDGQSGYMVYFGTGRYIASGDNAAPTLSSPTHTFYGLWDKGSRITTRADLLPQTISNGTVGSTTVRTVTNTTIQWRTGGSGTCQSDGTGTCLGWRDDLRTKQTDSPGEMAVSNPVLIGGGVPRIIFTTLIPQTDPCTAGGSSWLMELNPKNGGRLPEQVFDINGDGIIDSNDKEGGTIPVAGISPGIGIMPEPTIIRDTVNKTDLKAETGSTGAVQTIKNYVSSAQSSRQSWRQLK